MKRRGFVLAYLARKLWQRSWRTMMSVLTIEGSYGENLLEVEGRDRSTRESTPCSLVRESNAIGTPGSTPRQRASSITNQIICQRMQRDIPTAYEMDEFIAYAEKQQQVIFMDKYNFEIVSDVPLPGRYEWVRCRPRLFSWASMEPALLS